MSDALSLLTTFGRRGGELRPGALPWFPVVGAVLGAVLGGSWWLADRLWFEPLAAAIVVTIDLALTGMLHFDGLADSADGLLPHATRERRLAIMRAPDVGAFGVVIVALVLVLQVSALATRSVSIPLLIGVWAAARALIAGVPAFMNYARDAGMASGLLERAPRWPVLVIAPATAVAAIGTGVAGAAGVVVGVAAGAGVLFVARRRLGGFTGDVLGAAIVVVETVALVVAAARW
jgi:adenosylcobinamide-GDP ribazoletransferase